MSEANNDEYVRIARQIHPDATLPFDSDRMVWRYMDFWKFEALVRDQALYLRRLDLLQDEFEGRYSLWQIDDANIWLKEHGNDKQIDVERNRRERHRRNFFVNCWSVCEYELELLWKGYTGSKAAIAIQSRVARLEHVCNQAVTYWPLDISAVTYVDHRRGTHIDYADGFAPAVRKDHFYGLDKELRVLHWPNCGDPPDHVCLPVKGLWTLIERVVLAPGAGEEFQKQVLRLLKDNRITVPVDRSRGDVKPIP